MTEKTRLQRAILRTAYRDPSATHAAIASDLDCSADYVREVIREHDPQSWMTVPETTDWDDPERCPYCETPLRDGGAGFIEHIESTPACEAAFATWRDRVADDIGGEWTW